MAQKRLFDVIGENFLATAIDDLLPAADDREISVRIGLAKIAGRQPAIVKAAWRLIDVAEKMARRDARPADDYLANLIRSQKGALVVANGELADWYAAY